MTFYFNIYITVLMKNTKKMLNMNKDIVAALSNIFHNHFY